MVTALIINKDKGGKLYLKYITEPLRDKPGDFRVKSIICDSNFLQTESPSISNAYKTTEIEIHKKLRALPNIIVVKDKSTIIN